MKKYFVLVLSSFLIACGNTSSISENTQSTIISNPSEDAILWQQTSAEYEALCYQAYEIAKSRLLDQKAGINTYESDLPKAIIMDLDETVLNNSNYNGWLLLNNKEYDQNSWTNWVKREEATIVPGAKDFIDLAMREGFYVFYITNRLKENYKHTSSNLLKYGIEATLENCLFKYQDDSEKINRRKDLSSKYEIVMLVGDNLADFNDDLDSDNLEIRDRKEITEGIKENFGSKYIILPNVIYGNWKQALNKKNSNSIQNSQKGNLKYIKSF